MNKKKVVLTISIILVVLTALAITVFAVFDMTKPIAVMNGIVGIDKMPDYADANGDGKVNVLDILALMREQKTGDIYLESITLDDASYSIGDFDKNKIEYIVELPAGRPTIPQVSATAAEGLDVEVTQAYIPDGKTEGKASICVTKNGFSNTYTVKFVRSIENGFVLQYDDRYEFPLENKTGYTFESNNTDALTVDNNGLMTAKKVTNSAITVTATNGSDTKTLVVDRIEKAHINLFFVTGQSNGQGCYDGVTVDGEGTLEDPNQIFYNVQLDTVIRPDEKGKVYSFDVHPRSENLKYYNQDPAFQANVIYDMHDFARQGFSSPLGVNWYNYTGEKVIFLQSAWSGSPIEAWLNPKTHPNEAGTYGNATRNFYNTTKEGYEKLIPLLEENYEIVRKMNFWFQGETATNAVYDKSIYNYHFSSHDTFDPTKLMTAETYYKYFKWLDEDMRKDFGLDYNGIFSIRVGGAKTKQTIVPIVSAHFALCNENEGIFLAMRKTMEITKQFVDSDKSDGWNFMGTDNNHYNQIGYNRIADEAAENAFNIAFKPTIKKSTGVEIIDTDGKTRIEDGTTLELQAGTVYRLGVLSLPHYTSEKVTWTSTDENVASADMYCVINAKSAGSTTLTVTTESGVSKSINVKVHEIVTTPATYEWTFDDYTSSSDYENTLSSSEANKRLGVEGNYTIANGKYTSIQSSYTKRPDLHAEKEMYVDSLHNWSVEWRTALSENSVLLGQDLTNTADSTTENLGYIYLAYKANFGSAASPKYPVKFAPQIGKAVLLPYGSYTQYATDMNSWKLEYTADDNILSLWCSLDNGVTWKEVSKAVAGEFSASFTNLFGRVYGSGKINFSGECEYIKINCHTRTKITTYNLAPTYRWDFNDLSATIGDNDLTPSAATVYHGAQNNFTVENGVYSVDYEVVNSVNTRLPDLAIETPFVLSSEKNWEIQWRGRNDTKSDGSIRPGVLMGGTPSNPADASIEQYGYIYLAPATNFTSSKGYDTYPIKFSFDSTNKEKLLHYGDYRTLTDEMNTWKLSYDAETNTVTLYASRNNGGVWSTVNSIVLPEFNMTISTLFGRMRGDGRLSFVGDMDYIQVSLAE